jgi:hypothetical protein
MRLLTAAGEIKGSTAAKGSTGRDGKRDGKGWYILEIAALLFDLPLKQD